MKKTNYERDLLSALKAKKQLQNIITYPGAKERNKKVTKEYIEACDNYEGMKAIVNEIKTTIPNFAPVAAKDDWDNIEIEAVNMTWYKDKKGKILFDIHRTDDPKEIYFYSVYLHQVKGGVQCIADVYTEKEAKDLANLLKHSVLNYKDNGFMKADEDDF